jgi:hypothetical protein
MSEELGIGSRVRHPEFGIGVVINVKAKTYTVVFTEKGRLEVSRNFNALEVIEAAEHDSDLVSFAEVERSLTNIIKRYSDIQETVPMGQKWTGGKIVLVPGNPNMQGKEIPIDVFFNKIIMVRRRQGKPAAISDKDLWQPDHIQCAFQGSGRSFYRRIEERLRSRMAI